MTASVIDELVVLLRLDSTQYKKADKEVDALVSKTESKAKATDAARTKRMKQSEQAAKQFTGTLKTLALTIGSVLGLGGGAAGLVGAVVALTNFETNLRRATVSTGLSNREMQAWGSAARRLGADAQAGAQAIADLAREQKQFNLTGQAPTLQALQRVGVNAGPGTPLQDVIAQAQQVYRGSTPAQRSQMESGLAAQGVGADLITLIKSEKDVREEFARSFAESAEENRGALDSVTNALEAVKNGALGVADSLMRIVQPAVEQFGQWASTASGGLSAFNDKVTVAGGGVDGFMAVLQREQPALADILHGLGVGLKTLGETVDVVAYGFQSLYRGFQQLYDWIDRKFGALTGGGSGQVKGAVGVVGDAIKWAWGNLVEESQRFGPAPIGGPGGVQLTADAKKRLAATRPSTQDVMQYLIANGMSVPQAAAVAANAQGESTLDPAAFNPAGGGQGARGLFQLRGARIDAFRKRYGVNPDQATWQQQLDFMMTDPYERSKAEQSLNGPGGAQALGMRFSRIFEAHGNVAEDARRGTQAAQLAQQYNPVTGTGGQGAAIAINGPVTVQANNPTEFIGGITRVASTTPYNSAVR